MKSPLVCCFDNFSNAGVYANFILQSNKVLTYTWV